MRELGWLDLGVVLAALAALALVGSARPGQTPEPALALLSDQTVIVRRHDLVLEGGTLDAWQEAFQTAEYFGAFAAAPDGGYGWVAAYSTMEAARQSALARCARRSPGCVIVAEAMPVDPVPDHSRTLRHREAQNFQRYRTLPGAKAFAISENGAYGMSWRAMSPQIARRKALANCENANERDQTGGLPDWPCFVIHATAR
ncbi:DUF4189 domain-containing protein [Actibacterium ureilyticum]|uniref:DUF4189 domain-containing protein n=1 Tax=Actibacterium ureilyticum TaxID=1590614 RepID=UPI00114105F0|nr:DUF4189 domain-containing protein [Actibacterium ureilyticum]